MLRSALCYMNSGASVITKVILFAREIITINLHYLIMSQTDGGVRGQQSALSHRHVRVAFRLPGVNLYQCGQSSHTKTFSPSLQPQEPGPSTPRGGNATSLGQESHGKLHHAKPKTLLNEWGCHDYSP